MGGGNGGDERMDRKGGRVEWRGWDGNGIYAV